MTKQELTFIAGFTYLGALCTLSIIYWLGYSVDTRLVTLNYAMIMLPGFYFGAGMALRREKGGRRRRAKERRAPGVRLLAARASGAVLLLLAAALLVHTVMLWL